MVIKLETCALSGFQLHPVSVEVDLSLQLPAFSLVGLASSMTQESRERVRAAICNSGFEWPAKKITINLAPTDLPKWGGHFELPMALGILLSGTKILSLNRSIFSFGELSLSGDIKPSRLTPMVGQWLKKRSQNGAESYIVCTHSRDLEVIKKYLPAHFTCIAASTLQEVMVQLQVLASQKNQETDSKTQIGMVQRTFPKINLEKFSSIEGEPLAKLAALVALAGDHHVIYAGPHGVGKSLTAQALLEARGVLQESHRLERCLVDQIFHETYESGALKPVVRIQSSVTRAALEGSVLTSGQVLPGEVSRAHGGYLVMDEFLECRQDVLECLRQPLEEGVLRLQRAQFRAELPARFQLIATTNLCPCGHLGSLRTECRCQPAGAYKYVRRLSGPLLDRFDLIVLLGQNGEDLERCHIMQSTRDLIKRLLDIHRWEQKLQVVSQVSKSDGTLQKKLPSEKIPHFSPYGINTESRRGLQKILQVAQSLSLLDKECVISQMPTPEHFELAFLLRRPLEMEFKNIPRRR